MDLQASVFDDNRLPALRVREDSSVGQSFLPNRPDLAPFKSLNEAHECLLALLHKTFVFLVESIPHKSTSASSVPHTVSSQRAQLLGQFRHWHTRLELFQHNHTLQLPPVWSSNATEAPHRNHQLKALSVLKLHWLSVRLLLLHSLQDTIKANASSFDDLAEEQLQLARNIVYNSVYPDASSTSTPQSSISSIDPDRRQLQQPGRSFTLHLGVVTPIFLLALKTCKPSVRGAAVDILLAARGWREGFYDAQAIAKLVAELEVVDEGIGTQDTEADSSNSRALEWAFHPAMNVSSWENPAERLDGLERLWTAVA